MKTLPQSAPIRTHLLANRLPGTRGVAIIILLAILAAVLSASLLKAQGSSATPVMAPNRAFVDGSRQHDHLLASYEFCGGQLRGGAAWSADYAASAVRVVRRHGLGTRVQADRPGGRG